MICVKLDYSDRSILKAHDKNLFWMCDGCADLFSNDHFRDIASRRSSDIVPDEASLKSLKEDIAGLKNIVSDLSSKVNTNPPTSSMSTPWPSSIRTNTPKRKREDLQLESKPLTTRGTKATTEMIRTVLPPEELFWVYLSAFAPNTTDSEIATFVKNCMELTTAVNPKVVRLVPKDKDPATLSFVTYKVGVPHSLKDVAMSRETWPENIFFREFENISKNQRRVIRISAP